MARQLRHTNRQAFQILGAYVDSIIKLQIHRRYHTQVRKVGFSTQLGQLHVVPCGKIGLVDVAADLNVIKRQVGPVEIRPHGFDERFKLLKKERSRRGIRIGFALVPKHALHLTAGGLNAAIH